MKALPSRDKLRGGYYTPPAIAQFLASWALQGTVDSVLEPSCGDGNILEQVVKVLSAKKDYEVQVTAVELLADEAKKARARARHSAAASSTEVIADDFFQVAAKWYSKGVAFDAIVGNPPFIRYQDFAEEQRGVAFELMRRLHLSPSRLANAWLPFLAVCTGLLSRRGRIAMVIPAELFQVGYAAELRARLASSFSHITLVTFDNLVFPDLQQEVVLLLAERSARGPSGIRVCEVPSADALTSLKTSRIKEQPLKPVDHAAEKWTKYFLDTDTILLLRRLRETPGIPVVGQYVDVDVGVVTGNNDFFLLSEQQRATLKLETDSVPLVGRSAALAGTAFKSADFANWSAAGKPAYLFYPQYPYTRAAKRYMERGVEEGVHKGYKCRIRREWYVVPSLWQPDLFFLRQADLAPRFVANETSAHCTDTLHRGKLLNGATAVEVATAFNNSLSLAASEILGRGYGGGVMTYEPTEVERIPLPLEGVSQVNPGEIDRLIRAKKLREALDIVDCAVLIDGLGIDRGEVMRLRHAWETLSSRRRTRRELED